MNIFYIIDENAKKISKQLISKVHELIQIIQSLLIIYKSEDEILLSILVLLGNLITFENFFTILFFKKDLLDSLTDLLEYQLKANNIKMQSLISRFFIIIVHKYTNFDFIEEEFVFISILIKGDVIVKSISFTF